jgi:rubrerythrin
MIEFAKPSSPMEVWGRMAPIKPEYQVDDESRYHCGCGTFMLDQVEPGPCPWCGKGRIEPTGVIKT